MNGGDLLPECVVQSVHAIGDGEPGEEDVPPAVRRGVLRRQQEFVGGRRAAVAALRQLGIEHAAGGCIGIGADGAPVWPPGVVGSIAHRDRIAWCAAARTSDLAAIGIDAEPIIPAARARRVRWRIATRDELGRPGWPTALDPAARLTVAFSAKEAFYKCLYPQVRRVFDFLDVTLVDVNASAGSIVLQLQIDLSAAWTTGTTLTGRFKMDGTAVATAFVVPCVASKSGPVA